MSEGNTHMVAPGKAEWDVQGQRWKQPSTGGLLTGEGGPPPRHPWGRLPGDRILRATAATVAAVLLIGGPVLTVADLVQALNEKTEADSTEETAPERYEDPEGFALYVPEGWDRSTEGTEAGVAYISDRDERYLLQVMWDESPLALPRQMLEEWVRGGGSRKDGYEEIRLEETSGGDAELEYVYDHPVHGPRRGMVTAFTLAGSTYMVLSVGPEEDRDAIAEVHEEAVSSFCDADGTCREDV
ncbi:hypothetical protein [Nocardiopsis sp. ATB16-24]|uniref:hypothetical protein n=1 Tax=Nocardiopsis sp. ATB16-24 TaxID=3019555 RepID=UPI002556E4E0|nr:hypothetical protein [Nocardiopsis sp. ATB16-24]